MLIIKKIEQDLSVEYAGFFNGNTTFNLVSNIADDHPYIMHMGESGLVLFSSRGILMEIELLFINPIACNKYPLFEGKKLSTGIPLFETNNIETTYPCEPIILIKNEEQKALILFDPQKNNIDSILAYENIRFFVNKMSLIGIEIYNIVFDTDNIAQTAWLKNHKQHL